MLKVVITREGSVCSVVELDFVQWLRLSVDWLLIEKPREN